MLGPILNLIILVLAQTFAPAHARTPDAPDFDYRRVSDSRPSKFLSDFESNMRGEGLERIIVPMRSPGRPLSIQRIDAIFSSADRNTAVFVLTGVVPSNQKLIEKTVHLENGLLYHGQDGDLSYAVFVRARDPVQGLRLISKISKRDAITPPSGARYWRLLGIHPAAAEDRCSGLLKSFSNWISNVTQPVSDVLGESTTAQVVFGCTVGILQGTWNVTGGLVHQGVEAVLSPVETGREFWRGVNKTWDAVNRFYNDVETELAKVYGSLVDLPPREKAHLACEVASSIGAGVLVTYFTATVAGPAVMARISSTISRLASRKPLGTGLGNASAKRAMDTVDDAVKEDLNRSLFELPRTTIEQVQSQNRKVMSDLNSLSQSVTTGRRAGLATDEAKTLYSKVANNPVANLCNIAKYDPDGGIGFCFGRATAAHIEALRSGVDKEQIRKIWAVGQLRAGDTNWRYHVSTLVRSNDGGWYAIDPIMGKPMKAEEWVAKMGSYDSDQKMRIFTTEAGRFSPDTPGGYTRRGLEINEGAEFDPLYRGYFDDMMRTFRKESRALTRQLREGRAN